MIFTRVLCNIISVFTKMFFGIFIRLYEHVQYLIKMIFPGIAVAK